ncbi:MAG TPA: hypothetical protein VGV39_19705 [Mesorhizobium sp.]|jgi:hypothetical protein|uniref:hypothetical protein n=1 Tax=Mesorhizobium sp. TaxID=1871066 RepID=UPI002DDD6A3F|nr:hypothetical protein [Mesorhizobium sp.]HEV2505312.1 hypothetical protein [Mesorhizobium sp.]
MHFIYWLRNKAFQVLLTFSTIVFATSVHAQDVKCSLDDAKTETTSTASIFRVNLICGDNGPDNHATAEGSRFFIGLTLYPVPNGADDGSATLDGLIASTGGGKHEVKFEDNTAVLDQKQLPNGTTRHALKDFNVAYTEDTAPYDLDAQEVVVSKDKSTYELVFNADPDKVKRYNAFLFAAWREGDKMKCEAGDFSRPGCKQFGYVFGDDSGVFPFDAYPGTIFLSNDRGDETTTWIVQRFR